QRVLREAGYEWKRVGCHTFRHTFASHMVINGASIYDVQKLLGHKSIIMTQIYAHLSENATRRAVDLIEFNSKNVTNSGLRAVVNERKLA
ncbi:MAG: tyrosine-type recombinase/integrase, partial [Candidatus Marinimicrobia bacterium]|nr:tyrosine-type recombinase/integrase [Candidatus Neomarinimicrobiota bacterium]